MDVLMFGWEFPPYNSGGLGVACEGLATSLIKNDIDLTFVLPKKVAIKNSQIKFMFPNGEYRVIEVDSLLTPYITSSLYNDMRIKLSGIYGATLFEEVIRYSRYARFISTTVNHQVIHAHDWLSFVAGMAAQEATHHPLVVHVHATEFDRTGGNGINKNVYEIEKEGCRRADAVIAVSNLTKNILVDKYSINPKKIHVVHNGIDPYIYNIKNNGDIKGLSEFKKLGYGIVIFVGRITLQKGPDYFLQVAERVLKYNKKVLFIIAGSGDMERQIIMDSARRKIANKVLFAGFLRGDDLSKLYTLADLFIMPSVSEPFGLTALEALIHGTPVLMSKQSGVSEVINHALKCDFWDVEDMADKILAILEYKPMKNLLITNGNKEAHNCSWDNAAKKTIEVYKKVLNY